jgi:hypothetical protein
MSLGGTGRRSLQQDDHGEAEHQQFEITDAPGDAGDPIVELIAQDHHQRRAHRRTPQRSGAADDDHEQIVDAGTKAERRRADEALEMREQEPRDAGIKRGDDEDVAAQTHGVDAHALAHQACTVQRADRSAHAAIEQIGRHGQDNCNGRPDDAEIDTQAFGREPAEAERWDVADTVEAVQQRQRSKQ